MNLNLVNDPWINVCMKDGSRKSASLMDIFTSGNISDLDVPPHSRISVMRLLICIAQAAIDGPETEEELAGCCSEILAKTPDYLKKHQGRFNLFGNEAFLQIDGMEGAPIHINKLGVDGTGEHTPLCWDHSLSWKKESGFSNEEIAMNVLVAQNFGLNGTTGSLKIRGKKSVNSGKRSPCVGNLHAFVLTGNIIQDIQANMLSKENLKRFPKYGRSFGLPIWEIQTGDFKNIENTYLGRLVPVSRYIKIEDGKTLLGATDFKTDIQLFHNPSCIKIASLSKKDKEEIIHLECSETKKPWRELSAILNLNSSYAIIEPTGIYNLKKNPDLRDTLPFSVRIWTGGTAIDTKNAKYSDLVESFFVISKEFLEGNSETPRLYQKTVENIEERTRPAIRKSVNSYWYDVKGKSDKIIADNAETLFWSEMNKIAPKILSACQSDESLDFIKGHIANTYHLVMETFCKAGNPRQLYARVKAEEKYQETLRKYDKSH